MDFPELFDGVYLDAVEGDIIYDDFATLNIEPEEPQSSSSEENDLISCKHCFKVFFDADALKKHELLHSEKQCKICYKVFQVQALLEKHCKWQHAESERYQCPTCKQVFSNLDVFPFHSCRNLLAERKQAEKPLSQRLPPKNETIVGKCNMCQKEFTNLHLLKIHGRTHNGKPPIMCKKCGMKFWLLTDMRLHTVTVHFENQVTNVLTEASTSQSHDKIFGDLLSIESKQEKIGSTQKSRHSSDNSFEQKLSKILPKMKKLTVRLERLDVKAWKKKAHQRKKGRN